jgi:protein-S-isoprenylcysteine O-methyltransferase Ste14
LSPEVANLGWVRPPLVYAGSIIAGGLLTWLWPLAAVVARVVVRREERYLEGSFGQQYASYRDSVRRWL